MGIRPQTRVVPHGIPATAVERATAAPSFRSPGTVRPNPGGGLPSRWSPPWWEAAGRRSPSSASA